MEVPLHRHGWLNHWPLVINSISVPSFPPLTMVISFYLLPLVFSVCFLKILVLFFFQDGEGIWNFNVVLILSALQNIYIYSRSVTPSLSLIPLYSWSAISLVSSLMYPPPSYFFFSKISRYMSVFSYSSFYGLNCVLPPFICWCPSPQYLRK